MSGNIRYPNITGTSVPDQIAQIRNYLYQLADQLNFSLPAGGTAAVSGNPSVTEQQYNELRALIVQEVRRLQAAVEALATSVQSVAENSVAKIVFSLDEEGNLYYEMEE